MTIVQEFLRTRSFTELAAQHGVYASFSGDRRKASLNYDQLEAKESDPLARQCRGLILRRPWHEPFAAENVYVGETVIVARPFDRFFNHGQNGADAGAMLGREGTRVFEKLDGTLCIVHFDEFKDAWCVATRAVPDADRPIGGFEAHTFASLFNHALVEHLALTLDRLGDVLDRDLTYLFELTTPFNRVVVEYPRPMVHLLGMRHRVTGEEVCPILSPIRPYTVPRAPSHECGTLAELIGLATDRSPKDSEGLVVRGGTGPHYERVKVKNPSWVALSAVKSSVANSPRRLLEIVLLGKHDDVFPMLAPAIAEIGAGYVVGFGTFSRFCDVLYGQLRVLHHGPSTDAAVRKAFALAVQREKAWMPYFMDRFQGRCGSFREFVDRKRDNTGSWPDAFLDNLLGHIDAMGETR